MADISSMNYFLRRGLTRKEISKLLETPEATIANIGRLGKQGMKHTNEEIIKIMVGE